MRYASIAFDRKGHYRVKMGDFTRTYEVGRRTREEVLEEVRRLLPEGWGLRKAKSIKPTRRRAAGWEAAVAKGRMY